jgi:hypothetical protein
MAVNNPYLLIVPTEGFELVQLQPKNGFKPLGTLMVNPAPKVAIAPTAKALGVLVPGPGRV